MFFFENETLLAQNVDDGLIVLKLKLAFIFNTSRLIRD